MSAWGPSSKKKREEGGSIPTQPAPACKKNNRKRCARVAPHEKTMKIDPRKHPVAEIARQEESRREKRHKKKDVAVTSKNRGIHGKLARQKEGGAEKRAA